MRHPMDTLSSDYRLAHTLIQSFLCVSPSLSILPQWWWSKSPQDSFTSIYRLTLSGVACSIPYMFVFSRGVGYQCSMPARNSGSLVLISLIWLSRHRKTLNSIDSFQLSHSLGTLHGVNFFSYPSTQCSFALISPLLHRRACARVNGRESQSIGVLDTLHIAHTHITCHHARTLRGAVCACVWSRRACVGCRRAR